MSDDPDFVCTDCGNDVYRFPRTRLPVPEPARCATCAWIAEHITDPAERVRLLKRLTDDN